MKNPFPVVSPGQMLETLYHKSKNIDWQWSPELIVCVLRSLTSQPLYQPQCFPRKGFRSLAT